MKWECGRCGWGEDECVCLEVLWRQCDDMSDDEVDGFLEAMDGGPDPLNPGPPYGNCYDSGM